MTAYVSGCSITRSSGRSLRVDNNVHLYVPGTSVVSTYVNKSVPVIGIDSCTSERYTSDSHFTIPSFGHVPKMNTDITNKGWMESLFLTQSNFDIYTALPGKPVTNGLAIAIIPTLKSCTISLTRTLTAIEDPLTSVKLSALSGFKANLKLSSDGLWFMEFSNH